MKSDGCRRVLPENQPAEDSSVPACCGVFNPRSQNGDATGYARWRVARNRLSATAGHLIDH